MTIIGDFRRQVFACVCSGIPVTHLIPLQKGFDRLVSDGKDAHSANPNITKSQQGRLDNCATCSSIQNRCEKSFLCVDCDAWSKSMDGWILGCVKPSVDLMLLCEKGDSASWVFVEGKLGGALFNENKIPRHPTQLGIVHKYDSSCERLARSCGRNPMPFAVDRELHLIVSSNTYQQMRNRVARWNKSDKSHFIVCQCPAMFLDELSIPHTQIACAEMED